MARMEAVRGPRAYRDVGVGELLALLARDYPRNEALVYPNRGLRYDFSHLEWLSGQIAKGLLSLGVARGERVALWAPNIPEWVVLQFALAKIGAILVTVNTSLRAREIEYLLRQSETSTLITVAGFRDLDYVQTVYEVIPELRGSEEGALHTVKFAFLRNVIYIGDEHPGGMIRYDSLLTRSTQISDDQLKAHLQMQDLDDVINMQYTSGTTGFPKGVMLTHRNIVNNAYWLGEGLALTPQDRLEYFPAEDNDHELGGFAKLKEWLDRARVGFSDEAEALGLTPPRGLMIVGVQGCGKSLAAKVIARRWQLPLLKLDAGRLYDKFVGESEKNFRRATELAESIAPCVLWIDEIEKGMAPAGGGDSDAGLGRRLFGSFLTWLQEKREDVFVIATANDLTIVPPELLRKGRFDEVFFVDLPDAGEREEIFRIHLGRHKQDPGSFDRAQLVAAADGFSGAEIEQAVIAALYRALHEDRRLDTVTLLKEIQGTIPLSVSRQEDIERLRHTARDRFVPVG